MRKLVLTCALLLVVGSPAGAKLPYFSLEMRPSSPEVGERVVVAMRCYEDAEHTRPWSTCLGARGTMAWVHPFDTEGALRNDDWIEVRGHRTDSGAVRGTFELQEPGAYELKPLFRDWEGGGGFPRPIRFEVRGGSVGVVIAGLGAIAFLGLLALRRGRRVRRA
jgi:hypothetical protein